jgi:hypothetical protein
MRKGLVLLVGLFLIAAFAACSKDETPVPVPVHHDLAIATTTVPVGYTCGSYSVTMAATGGTAPYTWSLADGSALPEGLSLSADGKILGVMTTAGDFTFTVKVTDSADPAHTAEQALDLHMEVPSNPSIAVFFDQPATVCSTQTEAFTSLECYLYLMLDGGDVQCASATEFKVRLTDANGVDLPTSDYAIGSFSVPNGFLTLGSPFNPGIAIAFGQAPQFGPDPILVGQFELILRENLSNLSFKFDRNHDGDVNGVGPGSLSVVGCPDENFAKHAMVGREAAINY